MGCGSIAAAQGWKSANVRNRFLQPAPCGIHRKTTDQQAEHTPPVRLLHMASFFAMSPTSAYF